MKTDIKAYWQEKHKEARFIDVHLPDFESKKEIDKYIEFGNRMADHVAPNKGKDRLLDDDDEF